MHVEFCSCCVGDPGIQHQGGAGQAVTGSVCRHRAGRGGGEGHRGGRISGNSQSRGLKVTAKPGGYC